MLLVVFLRRVTSQTARLITTSPITARLITNSASHHERGFTSQMAEDPIAPIGGDGDHVFKEFPFEFDDGGISWLAFNLGKLKFGHVAEAGCSGGIHGCKGKEDEKLVSMYLCQIGRKVRGGEFLFSEDGIRLEKTLLVLKLAVCRSCTGIYVSERVSI